LRGKGWVGAEKPSPNPSLTGGAKKVSLPCKGEVGWGQESPPYTPPSQEGLKKKASPARERFAGGRKALP